jgi:hypothetical protein
MPKLLNLANRTKELDTFLQMAQGNHECRILLIEGDSGMGKSSLLRRFKQKCPPEVKYVPLDCKGSSSIPHFLSQVMNCLGKKQFQSFGNQLKTFIQGGVDFSENDIEAEKISIAIHGANIDPQAQEYRLHRLHDAFFEDLAKFENRIIIALDTYQMANETLKTWIESTWLGTVEQHLEKVVTVIAGQSIPDPNHVIWGDGCEHFPLTSINDLNAWCEFCSDLPDHAIEPILIGLKGHPKDVHETLLTLIKSGRYSGQY